MSPIPVMRQGRSNSSTGIKCHVCSREFSKNEHLKRHLRSHSKEKPYECTECKKLFVRRDTLSRHTKSHHGSILPKKTTTVKRKRAASTSGLDSLSAAVYPVGIENVRHNSVVEFFSGYTPNTITTRQSGNSPDSLFGAPPNSIAAAAALTAVPQPGNSSQMVNSNPLNLQGPLSSSVLVDQLISDSDGLNEYLEFLAHNFDEVAVFPESNNHVSSSSPVPPPTLWALETSSTSSSSGGDSPLTLSSSLDSASDTFSIDEALSPKSRKPTSVDLPWPPVFDFESDELYPRDGYKRRIVDDPLTTFQGISW